MFVIFIFLVNFTQIHWGDETQNLKLSFNVIVDNDIINQKNKNDIEKYIDSIINDTTDFYKNEFDIEFYLTQKSHLDLSFQKTADGNKIVDIKPQDLKPNKEDFTFILYYDIETDFGVSFLDEKFIVIGSPFNNQTDAYKNILIHEVAHFFSALDLIQIPSFMNQDIYMERCKNSNGEIYGKVKNKIKYNIIKIDERTAEIIEISKHQFMKIKRFVDVKYFNEPYYKSIINVYKELIDYSRYPEIPLFFIGDYYLKYQLYENALTYFNRAIAVDTSSHDGHLGYGRTPGSKISIEKINYCIAVCLFSLKRYPEAIPHLNQLSDTGQFADKKHYYLGIIETLNNQFEKAANHLRHSLKINPSQANCWFLLGTCLMEQIPILEWEGEKINETKMAFEKALELGCLNKNIYLYLAGICYGQNNSEKGKEYLEKANKAGIDISSAVIKMGGYFHFNKEMKMEIVVQNKQ